MSRGRNRPPRLEPRVDAPQPASPPTLEGRIERSKIVGPSASGPGPTELRRTVERLTTADRRAFGDLEPIVGVALADAWLAITATFGATKTSAAIDVERTVAAIRTAAARVAAVASAGGRIAIATASPASLITLHLAFAQLVRRCDGELIDLADFGPIRADGRTGRRLRWIGGVAVVSDGRAICDTRDGEAAREWMFAIPRPALVVADGAFAEVAWEAGIEVIAVAGLDRPAWALAGTRVGRGVVVPVHTDRPSSAYRPLEELVAAAGAGSTGPGGSGRSGGPPTVDGAIADIDLAGEVTPPDPEM